MPLVLMVCTGNSCRSPMAEGLLKKQLADTPGVKILSAGIDVFPGTQAMSEAIQAVQEFQVDISHHYAQAVSSALMAEAGLVIAMTTQQAEWLKQHFPEGGQKVFTLSELAHQSVEVADPYGGGLENYRQTARQLQVLLTAAEPAIKARLST